MNRIQWKDLFREIKKNKGRFFSLLFIVALGCAFYTGIRSSEPDMTASADRYYDETNFCDIRLVSTLGLTEEDLQAVSEIEGILQCEGGKSVELFAQCQDDQPVMNVLSLGKEINAYTVKEGRLPETDQECFMDVRYMNNQQAKIGDQVTLLNTDKEAPEELSGQTFTIVGYGTWAWYLNLTRGAASIGDGSVDAFMVLKPEVFTKDYYTSIYATVEGAKDLNTFEDDYDELVEQVKNRLERIEDVQVAARHDAIVAEGQEAIDEAKDKLADAKKELTDGRKKLEDGEKEYSDGAKRLADGRKDLEAGKKEYQDGVKALEEGKAKYRDGQVAYKEGLKAYQVNLKEWQKAYDQLAAGNQELAVSKKELEDGWAAYEAGLKEYKENKKILEGKEEELEQAAAALLENQKGLTAQKAELEEQKAGLLQQKAALEAQIQALSGNPDADLSQLQGALDQVNQGIGQLEAGLSQIDAGLGEIAAGQAQLASGQKELEAGKEALASGWSELESSKGQLEAGEKAYQEGEALLVANDKKLSSGKKQLDQGKAELDEAKKELDAAASQISANEKKLESAAKTIQKSEKELKDGEKELKDAREELDDGWKEYEEAKAEADEKIADAEKEIADGEQELADLEAGEWYVLTRDEIQTSVEYGMDAERIGKIAAVFPLIFFLVAALVSLTTMTRMVEEERMLIGTMSALGYGKMAIIGKYLVYALSATLAGGLLGVLGGSKLLPFVIMKAYGMLYTNVPYTLLPYQPAYCLAAIVMALICTVGAAWGACYKELLSSPASLMRPPAPKNGKKIFLEHISFLWRRMNFSMKSTARNLFRYKKRFIMTVLGIGGCMAILLVSYGLHDSIGAIVDNQYKRVWTYSAYCGLDEKLDTQERVQLREQIDAESMLVRNISLDVTANGVTKNSYLYVVESQEEMGDFLSLHDRVTGESYQLTDDGVILSEKLARMLSLAPGDELKLKLSEGVYKTVKVTAAAENYLHNYIYMTPVLYEEVYGEAPAFNECVLRYREALSEKEEDKLAQDILDIEGVTSVSLSRDLQESVNNMMNALNLVVWVLVIAAGLLVFVVSFNLNNINISERRRELATLKVLGFYDMEVAMYVYRENLFLTLFGILAGLFMGTWLHQYVITTLEVEMIMFGRAIKTGSYVYSSLLTILFSIMVNVLMYYKLKQINMVESLKSVE